MGPVLLRLFLVFLTDLGNDLDPPKWKGWVLAVAIGVNATLLLFREWQ